MLACAPPEQASLHAAGAAQMTTSTQGMHSTFGLLNLQACLHGQVVGAWEWPQFSGQRNQRLMLDNEEHPKISLGQLGAATHKLQP